MTLLNVLKNERLSAHPNVFGGNVCYFCDISDTARIAPCCECTKWLDTKFKFNIIIKQK